MGLEIHQLVSTVRVPARRREWAWMVERVARESLGRALGAHLGPALDGSAEVVLLEKLDVRLQLDTAEFSEEALIDAWTRAFGVALLEALEGAHGGAAGASQRFNSEAAWIAEMAVRVARGFAIEKWKLPEAAAAGGAGRSAAVLAILHSRRELLGDVLDELERAGLLEAVLVALDELGWEELIRDCSQMAAGGERSTTWERIEAVARMAASTHAGGVGPSFASHAHALWVFVLLRRAGATETARAVLHILRALRAAAMAAGANAERIERIAAEQSVPGAGEVLRQISAQWKQHPEQCEELLTTVRSLVGPAARQAQTDAGEERSEPRVRVRTAGLFLLADVVRRLEWDRTAMPDGVRTVSYLLAGAATSLLDAFDPAFAQIDEGAALFAGLGTETDFAGLRRFYASATADDRAELAARLRLEVAGGEWAALCEAAAMLLASELALRVRGFRRASIETIKRQLLCIPGTVQLGRKRMVVTLDPCPWNIALHISGRDETLDCVTWLGGRSLEIVLEGL